MSRFILEEKIDINGTPNIHWFLKGRLWCVRQAEQPSPPSSAKTAAKLLCIAAGKQAIIPGALSAEGAVSERQSTEPTEGRHQIMGRGRCVSPPNLRATSVYL